ncbi:MAG TPA: hypothetical protein VHW24_20455 [Bryobacteraceae bacterium]|jgi:hypothetical protein|nr:hypothetical protein [Bryobacteraceae bacterium]
MRIQAPLKALLANLIDYAGLYPPASLPLEIVSERYRCFQASPDGWILNRLVLPRAKLTEAAVGGRWRVALLVDDDPGPLPPQVETLETKGSRGLSLPTYCEAPLEQIAGAFAKVRTGGLTPEAIPDCAQIADFLMAAAARRMPFKATAGLHHPVRSVRALTYAPDSPRATMHGFLNVFTAAAFAWHGAERELVLGLLEEMDAEAFVFHAKEFEWRGRKLTADQIESARRDFAHSFGSCSFEEPISDLRALELLS